MSVDVTVGLCALDTGEPYLTGAKYVSINGNLHENPDAKPMTLRQALLGALDHSKDPLPLKKALARHHLAKRIRREDAPDLSAAHITALKKCVAERYAPLLVGTICDLLEPEADLKDDEEL